MISDSPYKIEGIILKPSLGFLVGVVAALLMWPVIYLLQPFSSFIAAEALARFGTIALSGTESPTKLVLVGAIIHSLLGGVFGLLYALCQVEAQKKSLIGIGVSYGVVLWALSSIYTHFFYKDALSQVVHTWVWLIASIGFGSILAQVAIWAQRHRPQQKRVLPVD